MNIIIGAHSTGKSTLLKEVDKRRPDIYTSDGFSRPLHGILLSDIERQKILNKLTLWRWQEDIDKPNCLFARSIIDSIVYTEILFPEISLTPERHWFEETYKKVKNFFYVPIEFSLEKDGLRPEGIEFQKQIDKGFRSFIEKYSLGVIELTGTVKQRFNTVNLHI